MVVVRVFVVTVTVVTVVVVIVSGPTRHVPHITGHDRATIGIEKQRLLPTAEQPSGSFLPPHVVGRAGAVVVVIVVEVVTHVPHDAGQSICAETKSKQIVGDIAEQASLSVTPLHAGRVVVLRVVLVTDVLVAVV